MFLNYLLLQLKEFLSASVQQAADSTFDVWSKRARKIDILVVENENNKDLTRCVFALKDTFKDLPDILVSNTFITMRLYFLV